VIEDAESPGYCLVAVLTLALLAPVAPAFAQAAVGTQAPDFTLNDQYDSASTLQAWRGEAVLIVAGDRHGNQYMSAYVRAVRARYERGQLRVVQVAHLRGVPFFLKGSIRGRFRGTNADGTLKTPVLLDWGGVLARTYGFQESLTNVYLVDSRGVLRYVGAGRGTDEHVREVLDAVAMVAGAVSEPDR